MKRAALVLAGLALAGCSTLKRPEEIAWQSLHVIDMAQTADGMHDSCVREGNPLTRQIIGAKPSTGEIVAYGITASILHATVSDLLRERSPTGYKIWQAVSIMDTGYAVGKNYSIGIRLGGPNKTGCAS